MRKAGSISIETAISFSLVLVLLASLVNVINIYRTDIIMQRSVRFVANEFELYSPLSIISNGVIESVTEAIPEDLREDFQNDYSTISDAFNNIFDQDRFTSEILNVALSSKFEDLIITKYYEYNNQSEFYMPDDIWVDLDFSSYDKVIYINVFYSIDTFAGTVNREIVDVIPFWGDYINFNPSFDEMNSDDRSLWELGNFERGTWIRDNFDTNLPPTFPVIDAFLDGEAVSITSIDLNSSWNSNMTNLERRLDNEFNDLSSFSGADVNINGNRYTITESEIVTRSLVIIIPENSPEEGRNMVYDYASNAEMYGISVQVIELDES